MSLFSTIETECPACEATSKYELVFSVNADRRPELRAEIMARTFQRLTCPECGGLFRLEPEFTYFHAAGKQFLTVRPASELPGWPEQEARAVELAVHRAIGDGVRTADISAPNQLHVPVGRPVLVHLSSKDVIHSFGLYEMRVKQDAIPGMQIPVWFIPTITTKEMRAKLGKPDFDYEISCSQLCGLGHYRMRGFLTVDSAEDFTKWIADQEKELNRPAQAVPASTPPVSR